jgi:hypothetical protein
MTLGGHHSLFFVWVSMLFVTTLNYYSYLIYDQTEIESHHV